MILNIMTIINDLHDYLNDYHDSVFMMALVKMDYENAMRCRKYCRCEMI